MRDILKLGLLFLGIMALVVVLGLIVSRCTAPDIPSDDKKDDKEEVEQVEVTPTVEAANPLTVRGTATVDQQAASVSNGVFVAKLYEAKPDDSKEDAVEVDSLTQENINHGQGLPTQWDFRVTAPNADSENRYFVLGTVYANSDLQQKLLVGKCDTGEVDALCSVVGSGRLMNFWMNLVDVK